MIAVLQVMAGGAIGSALRYGLSVALPGRDGWPWPTFAANIVGGFAMGLLAAMLARGGGESFRLFAGVGLLGGFTTFSAFSLEGFRMIERGQWALAGGYALASVAGSIAALALGYTVARG